MRERLLVRQFLDGIASPDRHRILLVATMPNEEPFILEWVAYHRVIGFTDIVVCSNDCVDESPVLLDRLHQLGILTHLANRVEPGEKAQLAAYALAERLPLINAVDWAMVLDADEYLNIHVGNGQVSELIDAVPQATAFLINWRLFGNSGHFSWELGFVTERFTRAALPGDPVNFSFKTLFTRIGAYHCRLMPHQPRYPDNERLAELHYVNARGRHSRDITATKWAAIFCKLSPFTLPGSLRRSIITIRGLGRIIW